MKKAQKVEKQESSFCHLQNRSPEAEKTNKREDKDERSKAKANMKQTEGDSYIFLAKYLVYKIIEAQIWKKHKNNHKNIVSLKKIHSSIALGTVVIKKYCGSDLNHWFGKK